MSRSAPSPYSTDKHLLALIGKWLQVGVIEDGKLFLAENGTYQGSVISPVLANVYLHEVLDLWVENEVKPRLIGGIKIYRFADDFVATFIYKEDAQRFLQVLSKRFEKFGLRLHPEKTRLIKFGRHAWEKGNYSKIKPETFNFLGFTHYCGATLKGKFSVKVKTMAKRQRRGLSRVTKWCEENRHRSLEEQHQHLRTVLFGHYAYYGRRNNFPSLRKFYRSTERIWRKWLSRRGGGYVSWNKLRKILGKFPLPKPRIVQGNLRPRSQLNWFEEFI